MKRWQKNFQAKIQSTRKKNSINQMDKIQAVQEDKDPYSSKLQRIQIGNWQCEKSECSKL